MRKKRTMKVSTRDEDNNNNQEDSDSDDEKLIKKINRKRATSKNKSIGTDIAINGNRRCILVENIEKNSADEDDDSEDSIDIRACSLCHSALDYSDGAAFFEAERKEDYPDSDDDNGADDDTEESEFFFRPNDPYLPEELYDKNNALVYCDGCDRIFHQKCHFVPIPVVPRGAWYCLLCQTKTTLKRQKKSPRKTKKGDGKCSENTLELSLKKLKPMPATAFVSPPDPASRGWELDFERISCQLKAASWQKELNQRLPNAAQGQISNLNNAWSTMETLTSTQKNRKHFSAANSQEVADQLVKLCSAKVKLRDLVLQLEELRLAAQSEPRQWKALEAWCDAYEQQQQRKSSEDDGNDFIRRVIFPFGRQHKRRWNLYSPEAAISETDETQENLVPTEIGGNYGNDSGKKMPSAVTRTGQRKREQSLPICKTVNSSEDSESSSDGISLDELRCYICHQGTSSDENDLIMCDGCHCYRAYHFKCLRPPLSMDDDVVVNEDEDWFCPLCSAVDNFMLQIQTLFMGHDWEDRRRMCHEDEVSLSSSLRSWDKIDDVFPEASRQYRGALKLREGKLSNNSTDRLLCDVLGLDYDSDIDDDEKSDNVEKDGHFNLEDFNEQRRLEKEQQRSNDDDDSDGDSSDATLVDISSVELSIASDELAALSEDSDDSEDDDDDASNDDENNGTGCARRSRRLVHKQHSESNDSSDSKTSKEENYDPGKLDESNILRQSRSSRRKPVDYVKLNDAIFGDLSDTEALKLDDGEEFGSSVKKKKPSKKRTSKSPLAKTASKNVINKVQKEDSGSSKKRKNNKAGKKATSVKTSSKLQKQQQNKKTRKASISPRKQKLKNGDDDASLNDDKPVLPKRPQGKNDEQRWRLEMFNYDRELAAWKLRNPGHFGLTPDRRSPNKSKAKGTATATKKKKSRGDVLSSGREKPPTPIVNTGPSPKRRRRRASC